MVCQADADNSTDVKDMAIPRDEKQRWRRKVASTKGRQAAAIRGQNVSKGATNLLLRGIGGLGQERVGDWTGDWDRNV